MSLFPNSRAVVIGLPQSFDLLAELCSAQSIRLATAFAHKSGWDMLAPAIIACKGRILLLAGTSFFHTEPKVLREWLTLSKSALVDAAIHTGSGITFHPKVMIVEGKRNFAIVGSGNLSRGGLQGNIECAALIDEIALFQELLGWFDGVFREAQPLRDSIVLEYERKWKSLRKQTKSLHKAQQRLEQQFIATTRAVMRNWDEAVSAAREYLKSSDFQSAYKKRSLAATRIKQFLDYPVFNFEKAGWDGFYSVLELGRLIPLYRDRVFRKKNRIQTGLQTLVSVDDKVPAALNEFLSRNGDFHVGGFGLNAISKILAVHAPLKWAVYNWPVDAALRRFGYVPTRSASPADKYIEFNHMMGAFKAATDLKDAYALDAFFWDVFRKLKLNKAEPSG